MSIKDLTGMRFGKLIALKRIEIFNNDKIIVKWHCKCDCGNEKDILMSSLTSGKTKSCGCLRKETTSKLRFNDLTNQKFGRLTVLYKIENDNNKHTKWHCKCDCGNEVDVSVDSLMSENTKSCGCLKQESTINKNKNGKMYNTYDLSGDFGIGYTKKGEEFWFDLEDYDLIKDYYWCFANGYLVSRKSADSETNKRKEIRFHRLVMSETNPKIKIDHIIHGKTDENKYDNRKQNLRIVTSGQNRMNSHISKNNNSGITGVYWDNTRGLWAATIKYNRKSIHLGYFTDFDKAMKARFNAEDKYFGEYSFRNSLKINNKQEKNIV